MKDQSGAGLTEILKKRLSEFDAKSLFVTSDGASNIVKACRLGNFLQQKCFMHGIDLFVKDFIGRKFVNCDDIGDEESDNCESEDIQCSVNHENEDEIESAEVESLHQESNANFFESHDINRIVDESGKLLTSFRVNIARI